LEEIRLGSLSTFRKGKTIATPSMSAKPRRQISGKSHIPERLSSALKSESASLRFFISLVRAYHSPRHTLVT
jgi:hypothetical protein